MRRNREIIVDSFAHAASFDMTSTLLLQKMLAKHECLIEEYLSFREEGRKERTRQRRWWLRDMLKALEKMGTGFSSDGMFQGRLEGCLVLE